MEPNTPLDALSAHDSLLPNFKTWNVTASDCCVGVCKPGTLLNRLHEHHSLPYNEVCGDSLCATPADALKAYRQFLDDGCVDGGIDADGSTIVYVYRMGRHVTQP
jgi:hypothetical protein